MVKSPEELGLMREGGLVLRKVLDQLSAAVVAGMRTRDIDDLVEQEFRKRGVVASFKGYHGYPASVCVSINDEVVHGIPGTRVIREGDVVSLDLGVLHRGFHTDAAVTVGVGDVAAGAKRLIEVTKAALEEGVKFARAGNFLGDVSAAIQRHVEANGFAVVREYTGHGVGRELHEEPQIPNFCCGKGPVLRKGMTLAIEPMVTSGGWRTKLAPNRWTVLTMDGSLAAHFEHTVVVTEGEPELFA